MKMKELKQFLWIAALVFLAVPGFAQAPKTPSETAAYIRVTNERADKIVAKLGISEEEEKLKVRDMIARQYRDLSGIQDTRDAAIEIAKKQANGEVAAATAAKEKIRLEADKKIARLHKEYLQRLSTVLSPGQIEQVKDGMTYGVAPLTYKAYLEMLPALTAGQKETIMDYLVEAREKAMDGGSSEEKHAIFGDYKGKINNYLSRQGYDLKKAGEEWKKRREAAKHSGEHSG